MHCLSYCLAVNNFIKPKHITANIHSILPNSHRLLPLEWKVKYSVCNGCVAGNIKLPFSETFTIFPSLKAQLAPLPWILCSTFGTA